MGGGAECAPFGVKQGETVRYRVEKERYWEVWVKGEKRGYETETRRSGGVCLSVRW